MSNPDFSIFYKSALSPDLEWARKVRWHCFLSTYNSSERVRRVFKAVRSKHKFWLVCPEYSYSPEEHPTGSSFVAPSHNEAEIITELFAANESLLDGRLCVDLTGFIRPHLLFLVRWLFEQGIEEFDAIYSEPVHYRAKERTDFSLGGVSQVRQIAGYEGVHSPDTSNNLLVIASGYDSLAIRAVAEAKTNARKVQIFGLPSLRADMYQENVIKASQADEALGDFAYYFAPAHDPFVTANLLGEIIQDCGRQKDLTNIYLSPLSTKAQVLGFGLFYLGCLGGQAASILYPFSKKYARETTTGISRIWKYTVDLRAFRHSAFLSANPY